MAMHVPLSKMYVDQTIRDALVATLDSGKYIKGEQLASFEKEFAAFCSARHSVAVSSGTAAIIVALLTLDIKAGDEIIMPSHSFIATATPAFFLGAKPVFVDIDPATYTLDVEQVKKKITDKTKAIIAVHLYGHPADMDPLLELAKRKGIYVIEDACQAHGATYKGRAVGSLADMACFSFFPSKNMTVAGDGGMISTSNPEWAEKAAMLKDHGRKGKYLHEMLGFNFRMGELSACIGRLQLRHLAAWNEKRAQVAARYQEELAGVVQTPTVAPWAKSVHHMYVIRTPKRDALAAHLKAQGIETGVHYPVPIHQQPCVSERLGTLSLPVTEKAAAEVLSLPMHPQLTENDISDVCSQVKAFFKGS